MDTHDLLRPLKYLWASLALQMVVNADFVFFCMHWLGRVDSAYTFSPVVCMRMLGRSRIILPDNPEFIPVAQTNTCSSSSSSSSVIVEKKKAYNTKSRQFLDNFPLITTFLCTSANISMIHLIRGYTYIISFRLLFIISDEIIFMSRIFHIALEQKMLAEQRNQQHYVEHSIALHMAWRSTFYPLAIIVHHLI